MKRTRRFHCWHRDEPESSGELVMAESPKDAAEVFAQRKDREEGTYTEVRQVAVRDSMNAITDHRVECFVNASYAAVSLKRPRLSLYRED